jgi:hypothetical protein
VAGDGIAGLRNPSEIRGAQGNSPRQKLSAFQNFGRGIEEEGLPLRSASSPTRGSTRGEPPHRLPPLRREHEIPFG